MFDTETGTPPRVWVPADSVTGGSVILGNTGTGSAAATNYLTAGNDSYDYDTLRRVVNYARRHIDAYQQTPTTWATVNSCSTGSCSINIATNSDTNTWYVTPTVTFGAGGVIQVNGIHIHPPQAPAIHIKNHRGVEARSSHKGNQFSDIASTEMIALQLLRKMVTPEEFRKYLKHGFINVQGASGLLYQIHRQSGIIVWDKGEKVASLCVHLKVHQDVPPTDHVVGKKLMVEFDEKDLWDRANVSWFVKNRSTRPGLQALDRANDNGLNYEGARAGRTDTINYNINAYETNGVRVMEELLAQVPGLQGEAERANLQAL